MPLRLRKSFSKDLETIVNRVRESKEDFDLDAVANEILAQIGAGKEGSAFFRSTFEQAITPRTAEQGFGRLEKWIIKTNGPDLQRMRALDVDAALSGKRDAVHNPTGAGRLGLVAPANVSGQGVSGRSPNGAGADNLRRRLAGSTSRAAASAGKPMPGETARLRIENGEQIIDVLRDLGPVGTWAQMYRAIIAGPQGTAVERAQAADALKLFAALPKITPEMSPAELVEIGVLGKLPDGWGRMDAAPRYVPGRQVMVATRIDADYHNPESFGAYKADGPVGLTHRATLVGERDGKFILEIDGLEKRAAVSKSAIAKYNQRQEFSGSRFSLNGVVVDYSDPYLKMKIYDGFATLGREIENLDFEKAFAADKASDATITHATATFEAQQEITGALLKMVNMDYSHALNSGESAGRLAIKGTGQCYSQSGVTVALMAPFLKSIGVDLQFVNGRVYRDFDPAAPGYPNNGTNHGWLQMTYRPVGISRVTDRTWMHNNIEMDEAYSFVGDRVPLALIKVDGKSTAQPPLSPKDIDFSGDYVLPAHERRFGVKGVHDRSVHQ